MTEVWSCILYTGYQAPRTRRSTCSGIRNGLEVCVHYRLLRCEKFRLLALSVEASLDNVLQVIDYIDCANAIFA